MPDKLVCSPETPCLNCWQYDFHNVSLSVYPCGRIFMRPVKSGGLRRVVCSYSVLSHTYTSSNSTTFRPVSRFYFTTIWRNSDTSSCVNMLSTTRAPYFTISRGTRDCDKYHMLWARTFAKLLCLTFCHVLESNR